MSGVVAASIQDQLRGPLIYEQVDCVYDATGLDDPRKLVGCILRTARSKVSVQV